MQGFGLFRIFLTILIATGLCGSARAQLGFDLNIKKPEPYQDRELKAESSADKKFTTSRRFVQNTFTHYNYYFNAQTKLTEILSRAKEAHQDDFSRLLSFYNYSLDYTANDAIQIDSIIQKAKSAIVLHDLRNDWADNMYLLWGIAYYLRQDFDSAGHMFQFINYAFADKEKDGYYRYIGSRIDGNDAMRISTREKSSLTKKVFSEPPSRNDAFIWQVRTQLRENDYSSAASLMEMLSNDPQFPERLKPDLAEVRAYYYYRQEHWDSCAHYLEQALPNATDKAERTRWEFLLAQLYEKTGDLQKATDYYEQVIHHTTDPVMEIYARLYTIRADRDDAGNLVAENVALLEKMARRERYTDYRDLIYYMAAQMKLTTGDRDGAYALLLKSVDHPGTDLSSRNRVFLQLAELSYEKKLFRQSARFYDSLQLEDPAFSPEDITRYSNRKQQLSQLAFQLEVVERQDSLQKIAALPEAEREALVKKLVKKLRKEKGLKDESGRPDPIAAAGIPDLFGPAQTAGKKKADWYFYNETLRKSGEAEFRDIWGNRPNVDNWRRQSGVLQNAPLVPTDRGIPGEPSGSNGTGITFNDLYSHIPLTEEAMDVSNDSLQNALYQLGVMYADEVGDCEASIETLERLLNTFPDFPNAEAAVFRLHYCYAQTGNTAKAKDLKRVMEEKFADGQYTMQLRGGPTEAENFRQMATSTYDSVYSVFLSGRFEEAMAMKNSADQVFGKAYWNPQLSYIEAVYHIQQHEDSLAMVQLEAIPQMQNVDSAMAEKARVLADVLSRRAEIEAELSGMTVAREQEPVIQKRVDTVMVETPRGLAPKDSTLGNQAVAIQKTGEKNRIPTAAVDTAGNKPKLKIMTAYARYPDQPHFAMVVLDNVGLVFGNEAKNAFNRYNRQKYSSQNLPIQLEELDSTHKLLIIGPFLNEEEVSNYVETAKALAASQIVPWLKADKYSITFIAEPNLLLLREEGNLSPYLEFLEQYLRPKQDQ